MTPYALAFGRDQLDDRLFPPIAEEAAARDLPLDDPDRFLFLGSVGRLLRAVAGDPGDGDREGAPRAREPRADMGEEMRQHGRLLYHAFHHWRGGRVTRSVDEATLRGLLDGPPPVGDWRLTAPAPAGYLQLPRNLVWAAPAASMRPEPADGLFWMLLREGTPALHVLLALGVREDRPGFSVIPVTGVPDDVPHWADVDARPGGKDFETTLPGGEMDHLYSLETPAEILKLASLCFRRLDPAGG
ncbi:MAG TPA: hypothetical protein VMM12_15060 [Longimicrobiales bacterium]|nr:hypothetical protein [Longimicrobiales bacterium]